MGLSHPQKLGITPALPETAPKTPEPSPVRGYLKMTLKRRVAPGAGE